jgi:hypothetical protein
MIRRAGRIEPGSGGAVFTGHLLLSRPALTAFTRARLSFFVRPLTDGTVIGGAFAAESFPTPAAVLEAVFERTALSVGVDDAAGVTPWGEVATASDTSVEIPSAAAAAERGSLPATQARDARRAREINTVIDEYLLNKVRCIG